MMTAGMYRFSMVIRRKGVWDNIPPQGHTPGDLLPQAKVSRTSQNNIAIWGPNTTRNHGGYSLFKPEQITYKPMNTCKHDFLGSCSQTKERWRKTTLQVQSIPIQESTLSLWLFTTEKAIDLCGKFMLCRLPENYLFQSPLEISGPVSLAFGPATHLQ